MSHRLSLLILLLGQAWGAGCTPPEPAFELGTGELEFEALEDGDEILVIHGPQGGYHLLGSLRSAGIEAGNHEDLGDPDNPTIELEVEHEGRQLVVNGTFTQGMVPSSPGNPSWTHEVLGRLAILDIADDSELDGEEVVFSARITPTSGPVFTDSRTLTVEPHPLN